MSRESSCHARDGRGEDERMALRRQHDALVSGIARDGERALLLLSYQEEMYGGVLDPALQAALDEASAAAHALSAWT